MAKSASSPATIAIVGGGFSGTMLAVQLLRRSGRATSVLLIDRSPEPGRGLAYATACPGHLLNVRARNMSAYADEPNHFIHWVRRHVDSSAQPDDYLPRRIYGEYVTSQLRDAVRQNAARFRCIQDEAVSLTYRQGVVHIKLAGGQAVCADKVVFALGNFPPSDVALPEGLSHKSRFVNNPWSVSALEHVAHDESILLLGSGLTSVDVAIELRGRGFRGRIHILSRHGLLPQRHKLVTPLPSVELSELPTTARGLLRWLRATSEGVTRSGGDWRSVIDSLRPLNQSIWRGLPLSEQRRFLRHLRSHWDVHRHRVAGPVADQLAAEINADSIEVHAGRLTDYTEDLGQVSLIYRTRDCGSLRRLRVSRVINCTGPESDIRRVASPLLSDLFAKGLARPDPLHLGLDVSDTGELITAQQRPCPFLFAVGPLRRGSLWETIAVPELREQVAELAELLTAPANQPLADAPSMALGV